MNETHVLTLLTHTERTLLVALLEDWLRTLTETLRRTEETPEGGEIRIQLMTTVALLNKLHSPSTIGHSELTPRKRPPKE